MPKYRKVLDEPLFVISTNRGFQTVQQSVTTYEETEKCFSCSYRKRNIGEDGTHI